MPGHIAARLQYIYISLAYAFAHAVHALGWDELE